MRVDLGLEIHGDRQLKDDSLPEAGAPLHQSRLKLPVSTQDGKVLLKLLQLDLAERSPWAPVGKVTIEVLAARVRTVQANLFQPTAPEPAVLDSHRPDIFAVLTTYAPNQIASKGKNHLMLPRW